MTCGVVATCSRPLHHRGQHGGFRPVRSAETLLTPRQLQILRLMASGVKRTAIASMLHVHLETVRRHIIDAYARLDVGCREDAYRRLGWLVLPEMRVAA